MNKKILLTNGCSWVNGAGLVDKETQRWSYHLAKKLDMEDINISSEGASNDRILRTTVDWITENKEKISEIIVVIGWTQITRMEIYNDITKNWETQNFVSFGDGETDKKSESFYEEQSRHMVRQASDYTPNEIWWRVYLKYYFNFEKLSKEYQNILLYLQSILKSLDIKYLFFQSFAKENITNSLLDTENILEENMADHMFNKLGKNPDFSDEYGHPGTASHKIWADFLFEKI
jgi:hypothetical protein